jgi:hypothetical protein
VAGETHWANFGGTCLLGEFVPEPYVLLPSSTAFGIPKAASYLYGTWRDENDVMYRALRGVGSSASDFAFAFSTAGGRQLERLDLPLYLGPATITREGDDVSFTTDTTTEDADFRFRHRAERASWAETGVLELEGQLLGPGLHWYHPWPEGGGCYTATMKYASEGTFLGRRVTGFLGHEIHYMPTGRNWFNTRYGLGMEICWQQIANEYDDGTMIQATFAYGTEGWGFAMLHDEHGAFIATTDVSAEATVRASGYPESIRYQFADQSWTWRIDPQGERAMLFVGPLRGADGTCVRDGDTRSVRHAMGNSDWWTDGRADHIIRS